MRLFVDNLSNVDFSFLDSGRGLLGETWLASIELVGTLDSQGMVCDFGRVKSTIREWLDEHIDHRLLIPRKSEKLSITEHDARMETQWLYRDGTIRCCGPAEAFALIDARDICPETVAHWCIEQLAPLFPPSVAKVTLRFEAETIDGPYYHYSHGLKKHDGNCQRIAHGHRSAIKIWRNGKLDLELMKAWATRWTDIYIGTQEDCAPAILDSNQGFSYRAQQGEFYLELPKAQCYLIDTDSTIEFIAQHIADRLKKEHPQDTFRVKAFEGLGKGALAEQ